MYNKMENLKNCCECKILYSLEYFSKNKNTKDGYNNRCKSCCSLRNKKRYELKKNIIKTKCNQYYYNNKETIKEKQIGKPNSYQKNKEWHLIYREKHKLQYIQYIKEYQKNTQPLKYANDPIFRTKKIIGNQIRKFLKGKKNQKTEMLLGYTYQEFIKIVGSPKFGEHIDHKIPQSWFLDTTPIKVIWNLHNLHIVNQHYNQSKQNRFYDKVDPLYLNEVKNYIKPKYQSKL